jgi:5-methylcytosine-specific restriction endonuclease McrA
MARAKRRTIEWYRERCQRGNAGERMLDATPKTKTRRRRGKRRRKSESRRRRVDYREYIESDAWRRKRAKALRHHGERCRTCGAVDRLSVHHKTYARLGHERMDDLEVLCVDCHAIEHEELVGGVTPLSREFVAVCRSSE